MDTYCKLWFINTSKQNNEWFHGTILPKQIFANNIVSDLIIKATFTGHQDDLECMYLLHVYPVLINIEYILHITVSILHQNY